MSEKDSLYACLYVDSFYKNTTYKDDEDELQPLAEKVSRGFILCRKEWDEDVSQCIAGFLYVGNRYFSDNAEGMRNLGITHVISIRGIASNVTYKTHKGFKYYRVVGVQDSSGVDITKHLDPVLQFLDTMKANDKILVHCQAGVSRSAAFAIACLMHKFDWNLEQAYLTVFAARPHIRPQKYFLQMIHVYFKNNARKQY